MALTAAVATGCLDIPSVNRPDIPQGIPPGAGKAVPYININAPGRTASKLRAWAETLSELRIPMIALEAYGNAAEIQRQQHPECGIGWTTIAGIAGTESKHGQHRGSSIAANGDTSPKIRGPELDGTNGNMRIVDHEDPGTDENPNYVRAMGPFQFLPETWARYGVDANGDGKADPDNLDDAALSAARYLCVSAGGDMTEAQGWEKAVLTYNNSRSYLLEVRDRANAYSIGVNY
ncbi:lytic transglycosylase domain-containing protein [Gordonia effusa]|nr:lytic murein transglycosylase [Gordonia effusa]